MSKPAALNPQQEQVADHFETRALVIAGPGSGKTSTITARVGKLLYRQVPATAILCLTFTNKAAQEMRQRISARYAVGKKIHICTFHSLCGDLLRKHGHVLGYTHRISIMDSSDQEELMAQIARQKYADHPEVDITRPKIRHLLNLTNNWRENLESEGKFQELIEAGELEETELYVIREYLRKLYASNATDFSGLLSETVRLLKFNDPSKPAEEQVLAKLHQQFRFIQVDEYQDTNGAQNEIVELLAGPSDNVLAVGDQDQSIYEWRGANPEGIARFVNRGRGKRGCQTFKLGLNYRSTPEIIEVADRLIRHSPNRMALEFAAHNKSIGKPPRLDAYNDPDAEANAVAEKVKACVNILRVPPEEIAVFYRLNEMSRPIETALSRRQIAYKVVGGLSFYDRTEIRDCLCMLRVLANPKDSAAFARIVNKPRRGVGEKAIGMVENYAAMKDLDLIGACAYAEEYFEGKPIGSSLRSLHTIYSFGVQEKSVAECLAEIVQRTEYLKHLDENEKEEKTKIEDRKRCVQELINSIALYEQENEGTTLESYLQYITLLTSLDDRHDDNAVRLMSLHAGKGLEFDVVFMVGCEKGLLPHKKAVEERPDVGLNEERRLCYVGFTRARKQLFVSYCTSRQQGFAKGKGVQFEPRRPSQFLLEAGLMNEVEYHAKPRASIVS